MGNYSISSAGLRAPFVLTASFTEIDGSTGTLSAVTGSTGTVHANLTPITSLITQRALATTLSAPPTGVLINAKINSDSIAKATSEVTGSLAPLFTALSVPSSQSADPIGSAYTADPAVNPMDALSEVARINVHLGTVSVGVDANKVIVHVPSSGTIDPASTLTPGSLTSVQALANGPTTTPITNVIVVVGENHTFDGLFGGYKAPAGQTVQNLLSQGIINADGTPGPNFALAAQNQAQPATATSTYAIDLTRTTAYAKLPQPTMIGILNPATFQFYPGIADPRFPATLPNGPFQLSKYVPYASPTGAMGDPMHRFFQMWQQTGGDNSRLDMFTWVAVNTGQGGDNLGITAQNPGQGGELMGFVNMSAGDAPYFNALAQQYAMSDNYHQVVMGGTGMNFFSLATGDLPYYTANGAAAVPPANQIENPNPVAGTNNFYTRDGYQGGSYVNCADTSQPGVAAIQAKLAAWGRKSNCDAGKYYLVNNYNPPYDMNGVAQTLNATTFTYPPQTVPTIGEALSTKGVSWSWYSGGREAADVTADAAAFGVPVAVAQGAQYNTLGDPMTASSKVMSTPALSGQLKGLTSFYNAVAAGTLPSVSFVVPKNLSSGHPGYSVSAGYEAFVADLVAKVKANPTLWAHTAILITTDEGGGRFDSGYIQNIDFFGDGPRIPMLVVSPYARTGVVDHTYHDHSSILKFIERNWRLKPLSNRSRDNLPNPVATTATPYKPNNGPAIGDLMNMFAF
jgi:phospholipase C